VPDQVQFATRSQLADDMITAAVQARVPARWVAADEAYGNNTALRARLREHRLGYVMAISRHHLVPLDGGKSRQRADLVAADLPTTAWTRRSAGAGSKGLRFYDLAWLADVGTDGDPAAGGRHSLLIRRNNSTGELAFYRCWAPGPVTLAQLVRVAGIRWTVEESFQAAKGQVGLDQHQVRRWSSWHRFTTLALAALAVLTLCAADTGSADDHGQPDLIRLTVNEIRRLINVLLIRSIHTIAHSLRWSQWRRRHQARARRSHYTRRLNLETQP
jgi:SRSO17 transposase